MASLQHNAAPAGAAGPLAGSPSAGPQFSLEDVRFAYRAGADVLKGVTLDIRAAEHVCVLGGNGSGKSTLVQLLNGLLTPTEGRVRAFGMDTADPACAVEIRRRAAVVFQHPDDQAVANVVADDVAFGPENLGVPSPEIAERVTFSLRSVGMQDFSLADPSELSGGQKQRVAIAGALAMHPQALILDEPAAMLDVRGRRGIRRVARELNELGITVVHVTHFMDDALAADRIVVLDRGTVALDGAPEEVFSHADLLRTLNLDVPLPMRLAEKLDGIGLELPPSAREEELVAALASQLPRSAAPSGAYSGACSGAGGEVRADAAPAISFESVSFSYDRGQRGGARALADASFSVARGSFTALIGHTGSGKSTALELACALKSPDEGRVHVNGVDTRDMARRRELRRSIGYVAQMPERQLFAETVYEDVAFGPRNLGLPEEEVAKRVERALADVGLDADAVRHASPFALSGGQQRSAALAGVLAMGQDILVLDEPMAGLDPAGRRRTLGLLGKLRDAGTTVLLITHSMDDVAELADHVVVLDHGRVALDGTPAEVFSHARELRRIGLGVPGALRIAHGLADAGIPALGEPLTLDALAASIRSRLAGDPQAALAEGGARTAPRAGSADAPAETPGRVGEAAGADARADATGARTPSPGAVRAGRPLSPVHRLDPRVKLLSTVIFMVSCLFVENVPGLLLAAAAVLACAAVSRTAPAELARRVAPIAAFLLVTSVVNLLFVRTGAVLLALGPLVVTAGGVSAAVFYTLRFLFLVSAGALLMATTTPVALTDAAEKLLAPLARLGAPVHDAALVMSIALRFVPTLSQDADNIVAAQTARGAGLEGKGALAYARACVPILVPLLASSLRHAENLGRAMDARCYTGGSGRTHFHVLRFSPSRDLPAVAALAAYLAALVAANLLW